MFFSEGSKGSIVPPSLGPGGPDEDDEGEAELESGDLEILRGFRV